MLDPSGLGGLPVAVLEAATSTATVMILDDDHAGVFSFEHEAFEIVESAGKVHLRVQRSSGARGKVPPLLSLQFHLLGHPLAPGDHPLPDGGGDGLPRRRLREQGGRSRL